MELNRTYQKILAELTGVGVNLNILVFRLRSLISVQFCVLFLKGAGGSYGTYQLVSVQENRKANMILTISDISYLLK
jgi:hypothetical protein